MPEINVESSQYNATTNAVLDSILVDITALATAVDVLAAKLNADAGVTDENYSVANAAAITTTSD